MKQPERIIAEDKIRGTAVQFTHNQSNIIEGYFSIYMENGDNYFFNPYFFKKVRDRVYNIVGFGKLPEEVKDTAKRMMNNAQGLLMVSALTEQLDQATSILKDIKRCGEFYIEAIELEGHGKNQMDGQELEKRIDKLLKNIKSE